MNRNNSLIFATLLLALLGYGYWRADPKSAEVPMSSMNPTTTSNLTSHPADQTKVVAPSPTPKTQASPPQKTIAEMAPKKEELREQVAENPHQAPSSLLTFAAELGDRLDQAVANPSQTRPFFKELSDCVQGAGAGSSTSVQAVCLATARRMSESVPEFKPDYDRLLGSTPESIVKLIH